MRSLLSGRQQVPRRVAARARLTRRLLLVTSDLSDAGRGFAQSLLIAGLVLQLQLKEQRLDPLSVNHIFER
jgi:hypothetical protein